MGCEIALQNPGFRYFKAPGQWFVDKKRKLLVLKLLKLAVIFFINSFPLLYTSVTQTATVIFTLNIVTLTFFERKKNVQPSYKVLYLPHYQYRNLILSVLPEVSFHFLSSLFPYFFVVMTFDLILTTLV